MNEKLDGEQIKDAATEHHPPEDRMWTSEGAVGEGQGTDYHKEDKDTA